MVYRLSLPVAKNQLQKKKTTISHCDVHPFTVLISISSGAPGDHTASIQVFSVFCQTQNQVFSKRNVRFLLFSTTDNAILFH